MGWSSKKSAGKNLQLYCSLYASFSFRMASMAAASFLPKLTGRIPHMLWCSTATVRPVVSWHITMWWWECWWRWDWGATTALALTRVASIKKLREYSALWQTYIALGPAGHVVWQPLLWQLSWYPVMLSSLRNSFEDQAHVDEIYGCQWLQWFDLKIEHQIIVTPMATWVTFPISLMTF